MRLLEFSRKLLVESDLTSVAGESQSDAPQDEELLGYYRRRDQTHCGSVEEV